MNCGFLFIFISYSYFSKHDAEIPHKIASLDNHLQDLNKNPSIEGSLAAAEKTSKVLKWNLVESKNYNKKNKVCFK